MWRRGGGEEKKNQVTYGQKKVANLGQVGLQSNCGLKDPVGKHLQREVSHVLSPTNCKQLVGSPAEERKTSRTSGDSAFANSQVRNERAAKRFFLPFAENMKCKYLSTLVHAKQDLKKRGGKKKTHKSSSEPTK